MSAPSSSLKIYADRVSQPSRTVLIFCKAAGIPFEEVRVNIAKGEQRQASFLAVNPLGKLPAMQDGDFCLPESAAIMRYLCETRAHSLPDHWYPCNPQARACVCAALDWHGSTLRVGSMVVVWNRAIVLNLGLQGNEQLVQGWGLPNLKTALKNLESVWLGSGGGPFVAGQRQVSIADLLLACEVEQLCLLDGAAQGPTMADLLAPHPGIQAWLDRVRQACAPHYAEVHGMLHKTRARMVARKQQQQASKL